MTSRISNYISVVLAIFKRDLLRIVRNPIALILIVGACVLPSAYAWWCTAANWDPYQSTEGIVIAVASEDEGAYTAETGQINVGDEVVAELKDNHELGWRFYDSSENALQSVYSGESYAALIVPKSFSADFTSILTGDMHKPKLDYYLNEKISASAPDFTNEGAQVIQEKINETFVNTVSKTVFGITQDYGKQTEEKGDVALNKLTAGIELATAAISDARSAFETTKPALEGMIDASKSADATLQSLKDSMPEMKSSLDQARTSLENARESSAKYSAELQNVLNESSINIARATAEASSALSQASADLTRIHGQTSSALAQAQAIVNQNNTLISQLEPLVQSNPNLSTVVDNLRASNERLGATITALQEANNSLDQSLNAVNSVIRTLNNEASQSAKNIAQASSTIRTEVTPAINSSLDSFTDALGTLSGLMVALEPSIDQGQSALGSLISALEESRDTASDAQSSLAAIQGRLENTLNDLRGLTSSETVKQLNEFLKIDPEETASFISAPVKLETNNLYPVKNYGSGVVAFFTSVALWVAGFVFIDLLKMRVRRDDLPPFTQTQAYFGRWLLFMLLGIFPPLIVCAGDLIMGIQCLDPVAFMFAGLVSGLVYVNLIYAFAQAFRYVGKALAVLFLIVQIPGSSGLYPVEMMPEFYQALHPLMPFTYTIDAFRECIGGFYGTNYATDLAILVFVFVPIGLFVGLVLGKWGRNLTLLLDKEIGRTQLFDGEVVSAEMKPRLSRMVKALINSPAYRADLAKRVQRFELHYPKMRAFGWFALIAQFAITFAIMILVQADVNTKLFLLAAMVIGVIAVDAYLIVIVYMKTNLFSELSFAESNQGSASNSLLDGTSQDAVVQNALSQNALSQDATLQSDNGKEDGQ